MKILALNAFHSGSHKAFIDGLIRHSIHEWTLLTLEGKFWRWRMSHAAISFSEQIKNLEAEDWDIIFCTDMMNAAELKALLPASLQDTPIIVYFHENQLIYPSSKHEKHTSQLIMKNFSSCLAADHVWFNSKYHMTCFYTELTKWLKGMPDNQPDHMVDALRKKSSVQYPGIVPLNEQTNRTFNEIPVITWASRWEYDKNPTVFFNGLKIVQDKGYDFKLNIIGELPRNYPECFDDAKSIFKNQILNFGYQEAQSDYFDILNSTDIIASTANHEFFGIAIVEAINSGAIPILPHRLSYPEVVGTDYDCLFYHKKNLEEESFADTLIKLISLLRDDAIYNEIKSSLIKRTTVYQWTNRCLEMDQLLAKIGEKNA
ncbi:MAG: DUF3524 domain-containing protein [Lentisphaeria bacterium]|nr:DUF3524 domain-containing protein [Lentisphaeria bacterium]NQZ69219.1 DUF3524 domain-containing protein [Lentisphaeria bacterium]